jgi:hypothetical protein
MEGPAAIDLMIENEDAISDARARTASQDCRVATLGALQSQPVTVNHFMDHPHHVLVGRQRTVSASCPVGQFTFDRLSHGPLQTIDLLLERFDFRCGIRSSLPLLGISDCRFSLIQLSRPV